MAVREEGMDGGQALVRLLSGNQRFCSGAGLAGDCTERRRVDTLEQGQHPFGAVLACADSRTPVELIFSVGIGDLFVVRNAGNLAGGFALESLEYAVEHLGVPLVLVLGHDHCGAVGAALAAGEQTQDNAMLQELRAAIGDCQDRAAAEQRNALHSLARLQASPVLRQRQEQGRLVMRAAMYDLRSGQVRLLPE